MPVPGDNLLGLLASRSRIRHRLSIPPSPGFGSGESQDQTQRLQLKTGPASSIAQVALCLGRFRPSLWRGHLDRDSNRFSKEEFRTVRNVPGPISVPG